ncbi:MAG: hypothetical protein ACI865_001181 [Flavobacteriaceae bacterium]|jgi:hypothetical protein
MSEKNDEKLSLMSELIQLAKADNTVQQVEFEFLLTLATQLGVTKSEFKELFEKNIAFNPPKLEFQRIVQFQRLILLMNVDLNIDASEMNYIKNLGIRMGLHPDATNEVMRLMMTYENKVVPPDVLIGIFKTFHN